METSPQLSLASERYTAGAASDRLSVSEAAALLNISPSSVQRLCNRNLLRYETTQGGHRRIEARELAGLLEQLRGKRVDLQLAQPAVSLTVQQVADLLRRGADQALLEWFNYAEAQMLEVINKLEDQLHAAILDLDKAYLNGQLETHEIWLAMQTARSALERLSAQIEVVDNHAPKAVGGSPDSAGNVLGLRTVEVALRLCGIHATGLNTDLTIELLADVATRLEAGLVWVSHAHIVSSHRTIEWHRELAQRLPPHVRVLIGGGALSPSIRRQLPPHTYYESIADLVKAEQLSHKQTLLAGPHLNARKRKKGTRFPAPFSSRGWL